ncbi:MAG: 16S rRNA (guanine(527)-N(7))-methyltransferase RsmG [Bacteroidales bacterium]|nr:16S rRNA (guanine(527)-N(7))-methyltransferase RsmG [Bacteroidales bacterium]
MNLTSKYFTAITQAQSKRFAQAENLYREWNSMINVISRKDIDQFASHHLLHSLAIAKVISFKPGTAVMDAGTGGGFPGIPLAIMFPDTHFTLVDSIGKKIKVVDAIATEMKLTNVTTLNARFETVKGAFDFVTGRAVSNLPLFFSMVKNSVKTTGFNDIPNGILYLSGGDVEQDIASISTKLTVWRLSTFFAEDYFITKKLVHLHNFL